MFLSSCTTHNSVCPLFQSTNIIMVINSKDIVAPVSLVHQCTSSCKFSNANLITYFQTCNDMYCIVIVFSVSVFMFINDIPVYITHVNILPKCCDVTCN